MAVFTFVQGDVSSSSGPPQVSQSVALPNPPTPGNLFCIAFFTGIGNPPGPTVAQDSNGNFYTFTTHSPLNTDTFLGYLNAPINPNQFVTVTWTNPTTFPAVFLAEFSFTSPKVFYDKDVAFNGTTTGSIILPTITPAVAHSLLFAIASSQGDILAPTAGSPAGPWIGFRIDPLTKIGTEYDLDASSTTAVNFTADVTAGPNYGSMVMAFSPLPIPATSNISILKGPHRGSRMTPPYNP